MKSKLELWWLRRQAKKSAKRFSKYYEQAKGDEREALAREAMDDRDFTRDKIWNLSSRLVCDEAETLDIPVPPLSDNTSWEEGLLPNTIRLTLEAQARLRQAIRTERKEKWGVAAFFLKDLATPIIGILAGVTGVLGTVMGLLSVLHLK